MPTTSKKRSSQHVTLPLAEGLSSKTSKNATRRSSRARIQRQRMTTEVLGFGSVSQETKIIDIQDPLERQGRQFWMTSLANAKKNHFLGKWNHREMDWAFYPLRHGTLREVKKSGVRGVHFAAGYRELGQMVEEYGADVSAWPTLADENASIVAAATAAAEDDGNGGEAGRVDEEQELSEEDEGSAAEFSSKEDDQSMSTVEMSDMNMANSDTDTLTVTDEGNAFETSSQIVHPSPDANLRRETSSSSSSSSSSSTSKGATYPSIPSVSPTSTGNPNPTEQKQKQEKGVLARIEHLEEMLELEQKTALSIKGRLSRCEIDVLGQAQNGPLKMRIASLEKEMFS